MLEIASALFSAMKTAAKWPDCVRSVKQQADGTFVFMEDPKHPEYAAPCTAFMTDDEKSRMEDYAHLNWENCSHDNGHGCHESYHFADVDKKRGKYDRKYTGTNDHDIVSAIDAGVAVLQGKPAPAPFSIKDQKEALLMIAHFVGDLHQPLHAGAVYLAADGKEVDADGPGTDTEATNTRGGNWILDDQQKDNLHHEWDTIPADLGEHPSENVLHAARAVQKRNWL